MTTIVEDSCDEINANYKPQNTSALPSFQQLAALVRSHQEADQCEALSVILESSLQAPAFRQPQNRPERFLSYEEDDEEGAEGKGWKENQEKKCCKYMEGLRTLREKSDDESNDEEQHKPRGLCTQI